MTNKVQMMLHLTTVSRFLLFFGMRMRGGLKLMRLGLEAVGVIVVKGNLRGDFMMFCCLNECLQ